MSLRYTDKTIASADNEIFRSLRDCLQSKGIKKHGLFLLSGEKAVMDVLEHHPASVRDLVLSTDEFGTSGAPLKGSTEQLIQKVQAIGGRPSILAFGKMLFKELDVFGTHAPLLAIKTWELPKADLHSAPTGLEVACALSDPSNLGALIRSASAFGASKVILLNESASPFHPRAVRAASAATFEVKLERGPSIRDLGSIDLIGLDMDGESLNNFDWPQNVRLLLGEEGRGVPTGVKRRVQIPIAKGVESLNATVAASIALYSYSAKFPAR